MVAPTPTAGLRSWRARVRVGTGEVVAPGFTLPPEFGRDHPHGIDEEEPIP